MPKSKSTWVDDFASKSAMDILSYRSDPRLAKCARAFVVTGKPEDTDLNKQNRDLLQKQQTGYWVVRDGRVRTGDAMFLLLPSVGATRGYPRELYAGVVKKQEPAYDKTLFTVEKFFRLPPVKQNVKDFLCGLLPPQGDRVNEVKNWRTESVSEAQERLTKSVLKSSKCKQSERLARLKTAPRLPARHIVTSEVFDRNSDVIAEVRFRANGYCGKCCKAAPFQRKDDGEPYLEVHHKHPLAAGGEDTVENAIALCPNCHREAHYG